MAVGILQAVTVALLPFALSAGLAYAALPDKPVNALPSPGCSGVPCRSGPVKITLKAEDGSHEYALEFDPAPYIKDGTITILPGETLVFRFSPADGQPGVPAFVGQIAGAVPQHLANDDPSLKIRRDPKTGETFSFAGDGSPVLENGTAEDHLKGQPPGTMIVSYHQVADRPDMVLIVEHNLPTAMKYDATMNRLQPNGNTISEPTTTCPVLSVILASETWPYPIGIFTLHNFRYVDTSGGISCE